MADSACSVCGFSTNDLSDFEKHVQQHEDTFTPKLDIQNLMKSQPSFMQNLPAVTANFLSNYYNPSQISQLLNKVQSNAGFLSNSLFNNVNSMNNGQPSDFDSLLKSMPLNIQSIQTIPTIAKVEPEMEAFNDDQIDSITSQKTAKSGKKDGKSKKVTHSCPHCNFTTVMSQHMKSHLEAHERHQGQMYLCDVCNMQFSQKANMHRHRMRHSGYKPYECRFCKKRFFRKDQMQEHSMTHIKTGEDFDCPVSNCESRFRQHSSLRSHLDEQHKITANEHAACKRCAMTFANSRRLLLHYQTKHEAGGNPISAGIKRDQSVLNDFSDEDNDRDSSEIPAKRPTLTDKSASPSHFNEATPRNDPLDLSAFSSGFSASTDFLSSSAFNWNSLGLPLSVAVSQSLPMANLFSPQLLPKSKPPNCESLFQSFANTNPALSNSLSAALNNANLNKFVEELNQQNSQRHSWNTQQQCGQSMVTATNSLIEDNDHSSTHSPTSDSLTSSTHLYNDSEEANKSEEIEDTHNSTNKGLKQEEEVFAPKPLNSSIDNVTTEKLECEHCGIHFNDCMLYLFHKTLHASTGSPWQCGLCNKECGDRFAFTTHIVQDKHSN